MTDTAIEVPCTHTPPLDVAVPTPGVVAGTCSACRQAVGGYVCTLCGGLVPVINMANRVSGIGCGNCGQEEAPGG